jgi:hypothetical protein
LTEAEFAQVALDRAILTPLIKGASFFGSVNWWDAKTIDQDLLVQLLNYSYPHYFPGIIYRNRYEITKDLYSQKIAALCTSKRPECEPRCLRFRTEVPECSISTLSPLTSVPPPGPEGTPALKP